jgi:tetratricopeptide (TPR) repeat protein
MTQSNRKRHSGANGSRPEAKRLQYAEAVNHAAALLQARKFEQAQALCLDILKLIPDDFNASLLLGIVRSQQGDWNAGLTYFEQALRTHPESYDALFNRAMALQTLGRHSEAVAAYDRALDIQPTSAESLNNRGIALQALKRHAEAVDSYNRALALRPQYAEALNNRAKRVASVGPSHRRARKLRSRTRNRPAARAHYVQPRGDVARLATLRRSTGEL